MQKKKQIVYIEDDPDLVSLVSLLLTRKGYEVIGVTDSQLGIDAVRKNHTDLILLDLMMPEMGGWDILKQLVSDEQTQTIPVIIISARSQPVDKVLGLHVAGVKAYICKPFTPEDLLKKIEMVLP